VLPDGPNDQVDFGTNGLSDDELAEVVYHASGYAGFPAAATARNIAAKALADEE
jgi:4-carboxymuconolactone decarboxylase